MAPGSAAAFKAVGETKLEGVIPPFADDKTVAHTGCDLLKVLQQVMEYLDPHSVLIPLRGPCPYPAGKTWWYRQAKLSSGGKYS